MPWKTISLDAYTGKEILSYIGHLINRNHPLLHIEQQYPDQGFNSFRSCIYKYAYEMISFMLPADGIPANTSKVIKMDRTILLPTLKEGNALATIYHVQAV